MCTQVIVLKYYIMIVIGFVALTKATNKTELFFELRAHFIRPVISPANCPSICSPPFDVYTYCTANHHFSTRMMIFDVHTVSVCVCVLYCNSIDD